MNDPITYRYKRTLIDAFGCDATQAIAIHKYKPPMHRRFFYALMRMGWIVFVVLLIAMVLTGCSGDMRHEQAQAAEIETIQKEEAAKASREFAGQQLCGPGARAQWDGDVLSCIPKRGKPYTVAEAK